MECSDYFAYSGCKPTNTNLRGTGNRLMRSNLLIPWGFISVLYFLLLQQSLCEEAQKGVLMKVNNDEEKFNIIGSVGRVIAGVLEGFVDGNGFAGSRDSNEERGRMGGHLVKL